MPIQTFLSVVTKKTENMFCN
ncbi:hypothetical protein OIU74_014745 [Salix koriyanagi]|uniref:Uncharacterized protein n=1 Tax=Salix koriyanagi TaxID=2511006 RepID=A0A9Q0PWH3_9ROSI|nr:hypothetical protein OIU74_014745 [Salix koriyanagi]